jgi:glycosyltransferase involved in cell wall biosynthesis
MKKQIICHLINFSPEYSGTVIDSLLFLARDCREMMDLETLCILPKEARKRRWIERFDAEGVRCGFVPRGRNVVCHLRGLLEDYNPLLFHSQFDLFDIASVVMKLLFYKESKLIWHLQSTASLTRNQAIKDVVKVRLLGQQLVDRVLAVGQGVYKNAKERGFGDEKLVLVPNAVDMTRFAPKEATRAQCRQSLGVADETVIFLLLGWDPYRKGVDLFIRAAAALCGGSSLNCLFLIIGREETRRFVAHHLDEASCLGSALRIIDPIEDFAAFLSGIDVLVSPSRSEGLPYSVLEAMAAEKLILSSDISGARQDYGGSEGVWFFPVQDWRRLSTLMIRARELLIEERQTLGERNYRYVRARYSLQEWSQRMRETYTTLLQGQNSVAAQDPRT